LRILHHRYAAALSYCAKARGAVAKRAGQDYSDSARSTAHRGRAQHRVDGGTGIVLARSQAQDEAVRVHQQMLSRGRDEDVPRFERLATRSKCSRRSPCLAQNLVERGRRLSCEVNSDKDRSRKIRRKPRSEEEEGLDPTGGGADGHDVAIGHGSLRITNVAKATPRRRGSS